ncbi:MAG: intermembrane transport protein PqiB [Succinivibrio sp.]
MAPSLKAVLKKPGRISLVWAIPLAAIVITALLIWQNTIRTGKEITLDCTDASGIEAGKTLVKFRSVTVGRVESVRLDSDYSRVILKVRMDYGTDGILRKDTVFYLVKPRVQSANISGLDTILSGNYIQVNQGSSDEMSDKYELYDTVPADVSEPEMKQFTLKASGRKKLSVSDPVTYRGFEVGKVTGGRLDASTGDVIYTIGIKSEYLKMLNPSTVFWVNSGMDMTLGPSGLSFNTDTLTSLISGGLTFDDFGSAQQGDLPDGTQILYDDRRSAEAAALMHRTLFVVMSKDAQGMLVPGSLVKFRGTDVGKVVASPWYERQSDILDSSKPVPVLVSLYLDGTDDAQVGGFFRKMLSEGRLCAKIAASNPISRGDMIALEVSKKNQWKASPESYRGKQVIPTSEGTSFADDIDILAKKLGQLDYDGLAKDLRKDLASLDKLLKAYARTGDQLNQSRLFERLAKAADSLEKASQKLSQQGGMMDEGSGTLKKLQDTLDEINSLLRDARPGVRQISDNPSSLIFGQGGSDPEPMQSQGGGR